MIIQRPPLDKSSQFQKMVEHVFLKNNDIGILQNETRICRYTNLDTLINILNGKYRVNPRVYFPDRCEQGDFGLKSHFPLTIYGDTISEVQRERHQLKLRKRNLLKEWHTSCFTLSEHEDYLFWRTYTDSRFGVMLTTTIGSFLDSIKRPEKYDIFIGRMEYNLDILSDDINYHAFKKSPAYKGENELRIYFIKNVSSKINVNEIDHLRPKPLFFEVDAEKLIKSITLSPFMDKIFARRFTAFMHENYKSIKIKQSNINERL